MFRDHSPDRILREVVTTRPGDRLRQGESAAAGMTSGVAGLPIDAPK
jgi:hypothetical protein